MTGIKSFRISDETKERLELLSASIGGNKDRVFNTLMDTYSLEQEKATVAVSDQEKNVETFEQYANTLVRLYLEALRAVSSSDDRIRGEFHNQLEENAKTIKELRNQRDRMVNELTLEKTNARLAVAFGMNVIAYGHHGIKEELLTEHVRSVSLEELYKESDVISLHCPLTKENMAMIRKDSIAKMKDGVILLNTARGPLICEQDLKEALVSGKVSYAAMDVVETEPIPEDSPLLSAPNVLITPHIAWAAKETRQRLMDIAVENLSAYVHGKPIHVVNLKSKG